jgi:hypothetical protein
LVAPLDNKLVSKELDAILAEYFSLFEKRLKIYEAVSSKFKSVHSSSVLHCGNSAFIIVVMFGRA